MELIDRQAAIDALTEYGNGRTVYIGVEEAVRRIKQLPSAQQERKTGKWIYDGFDHPHGIEWCHCSKCGNRESVDSVYTQVDIYPHCAKCGARMEGADG